MCQDCGLDNHFDQIITLPSGATVRTVCDILRIYEDGNQSIIKSGTLGDVTGHSNDGRANVLIAGMIHTFCRVTGCIERIYAPKGKSRVLPRRATDIQEDVVVELWRFAGALQSREHNCQDDSGVSVNLEAVGEALQAIMSLFGRKVTQID